MIIGFASELMPMILAGTKRMTYRRGYVTVLAGDILTCRDSGTGETGADVRVTDVTMTEFGKLPFDADGHEKYADREAMRVVFADYYHAVPDDRDPYAVITFEVVP